jgi:hypothetical protein
MEQNPQTRSSKLTQPPLPAAAARPAANTSRRRAMRRRRRRRRSTMIRTIEKLNLHDDASTALVLVPIV